MGDVVTEAQEFGKNEIKDGEHEERTEDGPEVAEERPLVAELEIGFDELL